MRGVRLFCTTLTLPMLAFGWGSGHDVVGRAVAARLPEPWAERLRGAALTQFCEDNHVPDARMVFAASSRVTPEEAAYLSGRRMANSGQFHSDEGRGVAFTLLVRALREKRTESALLWLGALAHSTADMAACNHDPIVHLATYGWNDAAWSLRLPNGSPLAGLDLGWVESQPETQSIWRQSVAKTVAADSGKGAEEAVLEVMLAGLHGVEACAPYGVPIVRDAASWAVTKNQESAQALAQSFSELGRWAVERVLRDFLTAQRLAAEGAVPEVTDAVLQRYRAAFAEAVLARDFAADSLAKGLVAPVKRGAPYVGVVSEPTWRMNDGMFGFNDRVLAAQTVASLRKRGTNAALVDVRTFMASGSRVSETPMLLVYAQKVSAYYTLQPKALFDQLAAYRKAGGKIIWVGGGLPDRVLCDFPMSSVSRADVGKGYDYSWTRLPVGTNAYASLRLKVGEHARRKLERSPSFHAGWHIPSNTVVFNPEAAESICPLAYIYDGEKPPLVGGAWPKAAPDVAYLPTYALFPNLWTREVPALAPFELGLDSQGLDALETAFSELKAGGLFEGKQ